MRQARMVRKARARLPRAVGAIVGVLALSSCGLAPSVPAKQAPQTPSAGSAVASGTSQRWSITWSDEFDAPGSLSKWSFDVGGDGGSEHQLQWYDSSNATITPQGYLAITATAADGRHSCWYGPCKYTSVRMQTLGSFSQAYGRFEARIKLPAGAGLWPAFWLEGANVNRVSWPACGEIDVIEKNGTKPNQVEGFAHGPAGQFSALSDTPAPLSDSFHVYGVDWTPQGITWSLDGIAYSHMASYPGSPFDHPFFLILDLAVGGYWPGPPSASTHFPARMLVDWIHVYRAVGSGQP